MTTILTAEETNELSRLAAYCPYREWYAAKPEGQPACYFDSKRKATSFAKKQACPVGVYKLTRAVTS